MSCKSSSARPSPCRSITPAFAVDFDVFAARIAEAGGWVNDYLERRWITASACLTEAVPLASPTDFGSSAEFGNFDPLARFPIALAYHLYTLFLFTKSDIKTTVIPITVLAAASTPLGEHSFSRLSHTAFWIWLHVLQFDVSNQTQDPAEDEHNKRDRPLPAGRITLSAAIWLRWSLVPLCCLLSAFYSRETLAASIALIALTIVYDEMGAHAGHWLIRNAVNAAGFASFEVGASLISSANRHHLDSAAQLGILVSAGIFLTTIQAQDFKDVEGDSLVGRKTLPIVHPTLARPILAIILSAWSIGLSLLWSLDTSIAGLLCPFGAAVAVLFLKADSVKEDQRAFYLYNVWLSFAHVLPVFWRLHAAVATA